MNFFFAIDVFILLYIFRFVKKFLSLRILSRKVQIQLATVSLNFMQWSKLHLYVTIAKFFYWTFIHNNYVDSKFLTNFLMMILTFFTFENKIKIYCFVIGLLCLCFVVFCFCLLFFLGFFFYIFFYLRI